MNAKIDTLAPLPGLGVSVNDARHLAVTTLGALGVNMLADGGTPSLETIYNHSLLELGADLRKLAEPLLEGDNALQDIGASIMRLHDRLDLIQECAKILADVVGAEKDQAAK